jgi:hypothetical protein
VVVIEVDSAGDMAGAIAVDTVVDGVVAVTGRLIDVQRLEKVFEAAGEVSKLLGTPNPPMPPPGKPPNQLARKGFTTRFVGRRQSIACLHRTKSRTRRE